MTDETHTPSLRSAESETSNARFDAMASRAKQRLVAGKSLSGSSRSRPYNPELTPQQLAEVQALKSVRFETYFVLALTAMVLTMYVGWRVTYAITYAVTQDDFDATMAGWLSLFFTLFATTALAQAGSNWHPIQSARRRLILGDKTYLLDASVPTAAATAYNVADDRAAHILAQDVSLELRGEVEEARDNAVTLLCAIQQRSRQELQRAPGTRDLIDQLQDVAAQLAALAKLVDSQALARAEAVAVGLDPTDLTPKAKQLHAAAAIVTEETAAVLDALSDKPRPMLA